MNIIILRVYFNNQINITIIILLNRLIFYFEYLIKILLIYNQLIFKGGDMSFIELKNITKTFNGVAVLKKFEC